MVIKYLACYAYIEILLKLGKGWQHEEDFNGIGVNMLDFPIQHNRGSFNFKGMVGRCGTKAWPNWEGYDNQRSYVV
ncbi:hypothetical protein DRW41_08640 [Neobacillus piezotolerans]|uniref:Uncharacterized protein n=1 Tax=Neobacillus piezotolerans TaxID=2259171 RepID=A0A3D8GTT9_9BACI|nr:hypothetical protein DRW41_08640 [Neobacillus piezotolerans]